MTKPHSDDEIDAVAAWRDHGCRALIDLLRDQRPDGGPVHRETEPDREPSQPTGPVIEIFDADRLARRLGHGDGLT